MLPSVALIVTVPEEVLEGAEARPLASMVSRLGLLEVQLTELLTVCVLPSLYVPVAVNCWVDPLRTVGLPGVTASEERGALTTVPRADVLADAVTAETMKFPGATADSRPVLLMVATEDGVTDHCTEEVIFAVVLLA